jgi:hypothetical protein
MAFSSVKVTMVPPKDDLEHLLLIGLREAETHRPADGAAIASWDLLGAEYMR